MLYMQNEDNSLAIFPILYTNYCKKDYSLNFYTPSSLDDKIKKSSPQKYSININNNNGGKI